MTTIAEALARAFRFHQAGRLAEAERVCRQILARDPRHAEALHLLGLIAFQLGRSDIAVGYIRDSLQVKSAAPWPHYNLGVVLQQLGRTEEAVTSYREAVRLKPDHIEAHTNLGNALKDQGKLTEAEASYREAAHLKPDYAEAHNNLGNALLEQGKLKEAEASFQEALRLKPGYAEAHNNLGNALKAQGRFEEAVASLRTALKLKPACAEACFNLGNVLADQGMPEEALLFYRQAVQFKPDYFDAHNNLGNVLAILGRLEGAVASYQEAVRLKPDYAEAHNNLGKTLRDLGRLEEAVTQCRQALLLKPDFAEAHNTLGNALHDQRQLAEAAASYREAARLKPDFAEAHNNLGNVLKAQGKLAEAVGSYQEAVRLKPDYAEAYNNLGGALMGQGMSNEAIARYRQAVCIAPDFLASRGHLVHGLQKLCQWHDLDEQAQLIEAGVRHPPSQAISALVAPFCFLNLPTSPDPQQQLTCASAWAKMYDRPALPRIAHPPACRHAPLRVGYLSADFRVHPVGLLVAELIEKHDRARVVVHGYSYGPDDSSPVRRRLKRAFDRFVDLRDDANQESARRIQQDHVDILVDLTGYTGEARPEILERRPAPIQVNYLGYAGTMGAAFMDYILVDDFIVPPDQQPYYAEQLVHLPGCHQVNHRGREISPHTPTRAACGLPEEGFVFCCFNNVYKITPAMFSVWMRLLRAVPGSVLWLKQGNDIAPVNLRREAEARGVSGDRLVFAPPRQPGPDFLACYRLADLFLDTVPFNAHATASDALWAGCPVLTLAGQTYASRVAGSLLRAIGLPELITNSLEEYENLALELARDAAKLAELRGRLEINRDTSSLFDVARFARHLETAFENMWAMHVAGAKPRGFVVSGDDEIFAHSRQAIELRPDDAEEHFNRGNVLRKSGKLDEATACYREAIRLKPDFTEAHNGLAIALQALGHVEEAAASYREAIRLRPDLAQTHFNLGIALQALGEREAAAASCRHAVRLKPDLAAAHNGLAIALQSLGQAEEAMACYREAIRLKPDYVEAHNNLANSFMAEGRIEEATASYQEAVRLDPEYLDARGGLVHGRQNLCQWDHIEDQASTLIAAVARRSGSPAGGATPPFIYLCLPVPSTAAGQLQCAKHWVQQHLRSAGRLNDSQALARPKSSSGRLRIGYLSSDFHTHATAQLMAEVFERHDRARFEVSAYSYGWDDGSEMRRRLVQAFDRFVDVKDASIKETARRIHEDGVDILVDLKGYTGEARTGILALRPAPIQVNYLGFPGTMGAPFIDYVLVDEFIVPLDQQPYFAEHLVYLPGCYQANDSRREISPHPPERAACGLSKDGFVFCCFNYSYKITPTLFSAWMRLLKQVPGSVLWLFESNRWAPANLRREAEARGVAPERLVFAPRLPLPEHLARYRLADLFLDTFPVNAHTTASDALWVGCPVLTLAGQTMVARVAGSLLHALGLPELVTRSLEEYERMALELARNATRLAELRGRLQTGRTTSRLFEGALIARNIEKAFETMWHRHIAGEKPRGFFVEPTGATTFHNGQRDST